MHTLTASELLDLWERGQSEPPVQRMLALLAAAHPETGIEDLARLPIGRLDACLLRLRERLFGPEVSAVAECPACREQVETRFRLAEVSLPDDVAPEASHSVQIEGYRVTFRLPTSSDLLALADRSAARESLLARCVLQIRDAGGAAIGAESLPEEIVTEIAVCMAAADPQADIELELVCPACAHRWPAYFDVARFLWKEVHAWALRTLRDVHGLARAYGWREADVLALSPTRRHLYLELARQ
jgi:hypothetical protein